MGWGKKQTFTVSTWQELAVIIDIFLPRFEDIGIPGPGQEFVVNNIWFKNLFLSTIAFRIDCLKPSVLFSGIFFKGRSLSGLMRSGIFPFFFSLEYLSALYFDHKFSK